MGRMMRMRVLRMMRRMTLGGAPLPTPPFSELTGPLRWLGACRRWWRGQRVCDDHRVAAPMSRCDHIGVATHTLLQDRRHP
eukprot:3428778-Pyramimonas_sp.AAC.1